MGSSVLSQTFESSDGNTAQKIAKRARIVLMSADGRGHRNQTPKPFTWTAKAKPILASHRPAKKGHGNRQRRMQMNESEH